MLIKADRGRFMKLRHYSILNRRGFTAIEITMVATIIAIIALLILPLFRSRTDDAKVAAVRDELDSIVKAAVLANADTGHWFRLCDMDNTQLNTVDTCPGAPLDPGTEIPIAYWNQTITCNQRDMLSTAQSWQGPYLAFKKTIPLQTLINDNHPALWSNGGPLFYIGGAGAAVDGTIGAGDASDDRYPVDPWGAPYIFFGPGKLGHNPASESDFGNGVVYSLGENGIPGGDDLLSATITGSDFTRETGIIGTGDDWKFIF
jgi:prepilin-type N-terminal cleavage/methylation domain-containing protein